MSKESMRWRCPPSPVATSSRRDVDIESAVSLLQVSHPMYNEAGIRKERIGIDAERTLGMGERSCETRYIGHFPLPAPIPVCRKPKTKPHRSSRDGWMRGASSSECCGNRLCIACPIMAGLCNRDLMIQRFPSSAFDHSYDSGHPHQAVCPEQWDICYGLITV